MLQLAATYLVSKQPAGQVLAAEAHGLAISW